MTLTIKVNRTINVPENTKLVSVNSGLLTLAKQSRKGLVDVCVVEADDTNIDFHNDRTWFELSISEMKKILKSFK